MRNLIVGITAYLKAQFPEFVGNYVSGNTTQWGPFLNLAPEVVGANGPALPYVTMQVFAQPSDLGFINATGPTQYVEWPRIRFLVWGTSNNQAMQNIESLCANLDVLFSLNLGGGERAVAIYRTMGVQNLPQPINKAGKRAYAWFVDYGFHIVRTLGVAV